MSKIETLSVKKFNVTLVTYHVRPSDNTSGLYLEGVRLNPGWDKLFWLDFLLSLKASNDTVFEVGHNLISSYFLFTMHAYICTHILILSDTK
jgi:hypothetical protein